MQLSENLLGITKSEDPIFKFKPWPEGGTTNSLSVVTAGVGGGSSNDGDRGNVRTRAVVKRSQGDSEDHHGERRKEMKKRQRSEVGKKLLDKGSQLSGHTEEAEETVTPAAAHAGEGSRGQGGTR